MRGGALRSGFAAGFLVACSAIAPAARAGDPAAAEALYRSAKASAKKGDWETACSQFQESQKLDPAPGTLINLADCEEHRGRLAAASAHYAEAVDRFRPGDPRIAFARDRIAALDKRVPRLTIRLEAGAPTDARVVRDGTELNRSALGVAAPIEPGSHVVLVRVGALERRFPIEAAEGARIDLLATAPVEVPAPGAQRPNGPKSERRQQVFSVDDLVPYRYGVLGTAGGAFLIGGVTGIIALSYAGTVKDTCGPQYASCNLASVDAADTGQTLATVSTIAFATSLLLGGAGAYLVFRARSMPPATHVGFGPGTVGLRGTF